MEIGVGSLTYDHNNKIVYYANEALNLIIIVKDNKSLT